MKRSVVVEGNKISVTVECPFCNTNHTVSGIDVDAYTNWLSGVIMVQDIPGLTTAEAELLLSGMCNDCFPTDDDECIEAYGSEVPD